MIMATKKSMGVLFGILLISAWGLASVTQVWAETLKCKSFQTATKDERMEVGDEKGHVVGLQRLEGLTYCENGEIAKSRSDLIFDFTGKGIQSIGYTFYTFEDGSTIVARFQRLLVPDKSGNLSAKGTSDLIKGTGRFEGIKGTSSSTGKNFPPSKEEPARAFTDFTYTYTLPTK
jgi:hypothetical protein